MATLPTYATVEACARAFDVHATADQAATLARLCQAASRMIDETCDRVFYPTAATRTWRLDARARTLRLPGDALSISALSIDGTAITGYALEPRAYGPPYGWADLTDADAGVAGGELISATGVWGFTSNTVPAGALASSPTDSATSADVTDSTLLGVGSLILVGTERMVVTALGLLDTTADLAGNPTASLADTTVAVTDGTLVHAGETITVDSERIYVRMVAGNNLLVRRAVDGSTLAAHSSGAAVYAPRTLTVERGALGTTAAAHTAADALSVHVAPSPITSWCVAEVEAWFGQEKAGWSLTVGEGEGAQEATGQALGSLRKAALTVYRNKKRGAV